MTCSSALNFNARPGSIARCQGGVGDLRHPLVTRRLSEGVSLTSALLRVVKARVALIEYIFLPIMGFDKSPTQGACRPLAPFFQGLG